MQGGESEKREEREEKRVRGPRGDEIVTFTRKEEEELKVKLQARERKDQIAITDREGDNEEREEEREGKKEKGWSVAVLTTDVMLDEEITEQLAEDNPTESKDSINSNSSKPSTKILRRIVAEIRKRWFLLAIFGMILLALAVPQVGKKGGPLKPEITTKLSIAGVFFFSGYFMKLDEMVRAIKHWQLHVFIQLGSFAVFPLWAYLFTLVLGLFNFSESLLDGIIILACIPTTTTTNVISTVQANGNEAAALFNSAFGNSIGVFVSPAVVYIFFSGSDIFAKISFGALLLNLFITVIAPLIIGAIFHKIYIRIFKTENRILAKIGNPLSSALLLFLVFCTFCDSFSRELSVSTVSILLMGVIDLVLYLSMVGLIFVTTIPKCWHFSRADRIAAMFTSPQKTLALGIALISGIFAEDPNIGVVSVPLMLYHPIQIIVGGFMVTKMKEWRAKETEEYNSVPLEPIESI